MKGLRFHAPLTDTHLQSSVLASDVSAYRNHASDTSGTPTYSSVGMNCNDNSSIGFGMPDRDWLVPNNVWSIAFRFRPNFATGDDVTEQIWDTSFLGGGNRNGIAKRNNSLSNVMRLTFTSVSKDIAEASYSPYWQVGQENSLVVTADTDSNIVNLWLNGNQVLDNESMALGLPDINVLWVGSDFNDGTHFDGFIRDFRVWDRIITAAERAEYDASGGVNNSGVAVQSISSLEKGLVLDVPCTDTWLQDSNTASDRSAYGNHLSGVGSPTLDSDGATFDGSNYLYKSITDWRIGDSDGSVSAWINCPSGSNRTILGSSDEASTANFVVYLSGNKIAAGITGFWGFTGSSVVVADSTWHHIVVTNGSNVKTYADGQLDGTGPGPQWLLSRTGRDNLTIGALLRSDGVVLPNNGTISNVKVWNRELTAAEVLELYNKGRSY